MTNKVTVGKLTFWFIVVLGYSWAGFELFSGLPFDAAILFLVTYSFHVFRNAILNLERQGYDLTQH
jgi:hypothetical protein